MADHERDVMPVDLLIVGAGPAGLATAIHFTRLMEKAKAEGKLQGALKNPDFMMMVIEKGASVGDHILSGAVVDPKGFDELIPDWKDKNPPLASAVKEDAMFYLTEKGRYAVPFMPSAMHNHGYYIASLSQLVRWMNNIALEMGIEVMTSTAGATPVIEEGKFCGVVTDDKGLDKEGTPRSNYEPGIELRAGVTVLAEGPRGSLAKSAITTLKLDEGRNPPNYLTGVKELWEIPSGRIKAGTVYHTMGYPLSMNHFGGGFIYAMSDTQLALGLCSALAYEDSSFDPHYAFQQLKQHPFVATLLKGGKMEKYGAKTINEGGYWAMPRLYADGLMIVGESGGFLNSMRLKGIHLAIKSGMMAAETAFDALSGASPDRKDSPELPYSSAVLEPYDLRFQDSWAHQELWSVRNFHQGFENGLIGGIFHTGAQMVTGGRGFSARLSAKHDHEHMRKLYPGSAGMIVPPKKFDGSLTFDKVTDVYASGTLHEENQPAHLHVTNLSICSDRCTVEYGNPCQHFCPAGVYEMVDRDDGKKALQINASNCVHCKTCDIADPYGIITWVPPEGGGGPRYAGL